MNEFFESFTFISYLIIGSFYCFGIYKIFDDPLMSVKAWLELNIGRLWCKPLISCPPCMGSFHGLCMHFLLWNGDYSDVTVYNFFHMTIYCICLCGLNYTINSLLPE